jgi:hypothetical protein
MSARVPIATILRIAFPCILIGGVLGATVGVGLGSTANGARVGIITGGLVAFLILRRR